MENLINLNEFKTKKTASSLVDKTTKIVENVTKMGETFMNNKDVPIPVSLVNAFVKKVKDESGTNLRETLSDVQVAEKITDYLLATYLNIENLPVSLVLGTDFTKGAQTQGQTQELQPAQPVQEPVQEPTQEPTQVQKTAQEIPAQGTQTQTTQTQAPAPGTQELTAKV